MTSEEKSSTRVITRAEIFDTERLATEIRREVSEEIKQLWRAHQVKPCLAAVRVGDDPASEVYVKNKIRACEEMGIGSEHHALSSSTTAKELHELIQSLNSRPEIDGVLVQMPLPNEIDEAAIVEAVDPAKDVDGFHPMSVGRLAIGKPTFIPCTPFGIIELLKRSNIPIAGANACVVGRSQIVGRPMAILLLQNDATVTICHSRTRDLQFVTQQADILVVAIGRVGFIRKQHIKPGATVIDVGMNKVTEPAAAVALFGSDSDRRIETIAKRGYTLAGDVHPAEAEEVAGRLTRVPGGVGLLTVAMLMRNTLKAARLRRG